MTSLRKTRNTILPVAVSLAFLVCSLILQAQAADAIDPSIETARRIRDERQLQALRTQLQQQTRTNPKDAHGWYELAQVQGYLVDVYEARRDKKGANQVIDSAIEAAQRSLQLDDKSANAHSLLADLYGQKIGLGNGMFTGPKFGPKVKEENQRAMALDDKNPRVWASLGRQYLMAPKMFGGDAKKAVESFQKSLALDVQQDETYVWLAKAYAKQGDKSKAREALQHALELNPQSKSAKETEAMLQK